MLIVTSNVEPAPFEVESLGGGRQRLIANVGAETVEVQATEQEEAHSTWRYARYICEDVCDQTPERMADNGTPWQAYIMAADRAVAAEEVRGLRDALLARCDWTVASDAKTDKAAWQAYRQALRDVPEQESFPYAVAWPEAPHE